MTLGRVALIRRLRLSQRYRARLRIIRAGRFYSPENSWFLFLLTLLSGAQLLLGGVRPETIESVMAPVLVVVWAWTLVIGSVLGILGLVWRGHYVTSMTLEEVGQILTGAVALIYAYAVYNAGRPGSVIGGVIILVFALKCLGRAKSIHDHIRSLPHA